MRHRKKRITLNRPSDQRKALVRNLLTSLFEYGKVRTTSAKARVLAISAEKLISKIKSKDQMNAIRELKKVVFTEKSSKNALDFAQKTAKTSGFTRKTRVDVRAGDASTVVQVELLRDEKNSKNTA